MKAVGLAIETIIVLILAVTVLSVLLYFFNYFYNPSQTKLDLMNKQKDLCVQYVRIDKTCEEMIDSSELADIVDKIRDVCSKLDYGECKAGSDVECVKACCKMFCH